MLRSSLIRHLFNKSQADLSLSNTPHPMQEKVLSCPGSIAGTGEVILEFGENFGAACESSA